MQRGSPTCQNDPHISLVSISTLYRWLQDAIPPDSCEVGSALSVSLLQKASTSSCLVGQSFLSYFVSDVEQPSRQVHTLSRQHDGKNHVVSKGFFHAALRFLLVYTTSRDGGCSCAVSGTMTSEKLLHPITLPEGQPHVLESRGYDEAPTDLCWYFLLGGMVELNQTMDHRSVLMNQSNLDQENMNPRDLMGKSWRHNGFRAPYWRWEVTWAAAFLLITMNGRPLTANFFWWMAANGDLKLCLSLVTLSWIVGLM